MEEYVGWLLVLILFLNQLLRNVTFALNFNVGLQTGLLLQAKAHVRSVNEAKFLSVFSNPNIWCHSIPGLLQTPTLGIAE